MKAKKSKKPHWDGKDFDSFEEREFYWWCEEAIRAGFIESFEYHPASYNLIPRFSWKYRKEMVRKTKLEDMFLLNPCKYTLDFIIKITPRFQVFKHNMKARDNYTFHIDVKGGYSKFNDEKYFSLIRKVVFEKTGIFVNKVIPKEFFPMTFCPARSARTGTGQPRKHYRDMPTIRQAMSINTIATPAIDFVDPADIQEAPDLFQSEPEFKFDFPDTSGSI